MHKYTLKKRKWSARKKLADYFLFYKLDTKLIKKSIYFKK